MKTYAIRHVAFEDLGLWTPVLTASGHEVRYFQAGIDDLRPCLLDEPNLLVILGGPIGVYEKYNTHSSMMNSPSFVNALQTTYPPSASVWVHR